nr:hypothetical protein [Tanacetum cinerariifolium]
EGYKEGRSKELRPEMSRSLKDKIICDLNKTPDLFQEPPQNYPKCGNPVNGQYCQGCALLRKKFKKDLFTYCIENGILQGLLDNSEPSDDNTNIVNALQEPFFVKQDPGENSSQSPLQINHHCCYGSGDSLEDIFCHQCTCEFCGKGAHYGYNCLLKFRLSLIRNHAIIKTLMSSHKLCQVLIQHAILEMKIHSLMIPNLTLLMILLTLSTHLLNPRHIHMSFVGTMLIMVTTFPIIHQPIREKTCAELLAEEQEANINTQPFQYSIVPQPPQEEIKLFRRLHNDVQNIHEELAVYINSPSWDRPTICYSDDDDEDCTIVITLILSTEEPDNSLNQYEDFSDSNDDSTSIDDDSFSIDNIEYVKASPPNSELISLEVMEIVIPKVGGIDADILLTIKEDILRKNC